ncbi:hypothetical protein CerSpe_166460 [Prunus speciosa]
MANIWRPKANVLIVLLKHDLLTFAFNTREERDMVKKGGSWLFNGYLVALAEVDGVSNLTKILLTSQEFCVQVKGLPLSFMTRLMGSMIGEALGGYVVTDPSRKEVQLGSCLGVRTLVDLTKPLRQSLILRLDREPIKVALRYEKLPITCYRCGCIGHMETSSSLIGDIYHDDRAKPYGKWF